MLRLASLQIEAPVAGRLDGDTLEVCLSGEEIVARRVDGFLTFFVTPGSTSEVPGFALKNLKRNLREADIRWPSNKAPSGAFVLELALSPSGRWRRRSTR